MGLLSHNMLMIVKGVGAIPGDTGSAEQPLVSLDLLDTGSGISIDLQDGWQPNIPSLKNGGVWADSNVNDGRRLIAGANTNVTETMRLIISNQTTLAFAAQFAKLKRMIEDARAFWESFGQIEPVYLAWWAAGAPRMQYAVIFNIDMDVEMGDSEDAEATITLTLEREVYWRGEVPPGGNPRQWALKKQNIKFDSNTASLIAGTSHLAYSTAVSNAIEFSSTYVISSGNYIDIPASAIPGDAPALACISMGDFPNVTELYIAKTTRPTSITDRAGNAIPLFHDIPAAGMAAVGNSVVTVDATNGIRYQPVTGANRSTLIHTPAGATEEIAAAVKPGTTFATNMRHTMFRGRYMVFLRASQVGGVAGQTTARIEIKMSDSATVVAFNSGQVPMGLNGSQSNLMYMGVASIPPDDSMLVSHDGRGLQVETVFAVLVYTTRSAGASTQRLIDVLFIPIDEGIVYIKPDATLPTSVNLFDNTGYLMHGRLDPVGGVRSSSGTEDFYISECRGNLTLTPGVNNRLYFLWYDGNTFLSTPGAGVGIPVRVNIVPRWMGIVDN